MVRSPGHRLSDVDRAATMTPMEADITDKTANTTCKQGLLKYEPWRVLAVGLVVGAALEGALGSRLDPPPPPRIDFTFRITFQPGAIVVAPGPVAASTN